jgi:phosphatidylserine/phosphatidylglycerophosphate/cardiolipin synthase-like enzyme
VTRLKAGVTAGQSTVEVYTSPHPTPDLDPLPALLALVNKATTSILVGSYSFTLPTLAQAVIAKHNAGVTVRIAADAGEFTPTSQYPVLVAAGLDIHVWGTTYDLQHLKVIVVDGEHCAWGSFNFSVNAETDNYEVMTTTTNAKLGAVLNTAIEAAYNAGKAPA